MVDAIEEKDKITDYGLSSRNSEKSLEGTKTLRKEGINDSKNMM